MCGDSYELATRRVARALDAMCGQPWLWPPTQEHICCTERHEHSAAASFRKIQKREMSIYEGAMRCVHFDVVSLGQLR